VIASPGEKVAPQEETDETLMLRYRDTGDEAAFAALFQRYAARMHGLFRRFGAGDADASDLVQRTFLQVHRARNDFTPGLVRPWIYAIALNVRREEGRRRGRRREVAVDEADVPGVAPDVSSPSDRLMQRALMQLSEGQREVIVLHWVEELSFPEIAELLGTSVSAVKVRAHRAYEALRNLLGER
jgi:RNA polymerase sigma factor (sigma-70 family)